VIAGYDPNDPVTAFGYGQKPKTYTSFLSPNGLAGMRFGVIRAPMARDTDPSASDYREVQTAVTKAAKVLASRGAEVIDPIAIPNLKEMIAAANGGEGAEAEAAIDGFLAQQPNAPVHSLREIVASPAVNAKRREELNRGLGHTTKDAAYFKE